MTEQRHLGPDEEADAALHAKLSDALRTQPLDVEALERVRAAVAQEWQVATAKAAGATSRSQRKWRFAVAAAAGIAAISMAVLVARTGAEPAVIGSLARMDHGGTDVRWALVRHRALHVGDPLRAGDTVTTHGPALVSLVRGGTLRIAAGSTLVVTDATQLSVTHGLIYVDTPPELGAANGVRVMTRAGMVEHLGTEFEVLSDDRAVRIRVREGRIRLLATAGALIAAEGTEVLAGPSGPPSQRSVDTYGRDWLWVAALAPDYEIEGRPLIDFLQWVSREVGRRLDFADPHAREVADRTIMHGSVTGREPLDALANVLATTSLTYEIRGDSIRVHSGP
jgi:ferric-dicitrate binding protein FerR (iron transport regulator)